MQIYTFGNGEAQGRAHMKETLGGKGANLAEMCRLGLPVPPGFTLPTEACHSGFQNDALTEELDTLITQGLSHIEQMLDRKFGEPTKPLLLSVRSGAPVSMPGMMDTILTVSYTHLRAPRDRQKSRMPSSA